MRITDRETQPEDVTFLTDCFLRSMRDSIALCRGDWNEARERAQFERQLDLQGTRIIRADDLDVGFVICVEKPTALQMHTLCVAPEHQNCGIGSRVTMDVIERGRRAGCDIVLSVLKTNTRAEKLYQRLGFTVVKESEHHRHMKHTGKPSPG
jgi:ribosomal protein S18 acetylase RimI-like enzyme